MRGRSGTVKALIAKGIRLADTTSDTDDLSVQLLIGADQYHNFVYTQTSGSMSLIPSRLRTMIAGNIVVRDSAGNSEHSCVEAVTVLRVAAEEDSSLDNTSNYGLAYDRMKSICNTLRRDKNNLLLIGSIIKDATHIEEYDCNRIISSNMIEVVHDSS